MMQDTLMISDTVMNIKDLLTADVKKDRTRGELVGSPDKLK